MKTFLTKSGIVLGTLGIAVLYLLGLYCAEGVPPYTLDFLSAASEYLFSLAGFCIIGISAAWFLHTGPKDNPSLIRRWYRLLPAAAAGVTVYLTIDVLRLFGYSSDIPEIFFRFFLPIVFWSIGTALVRLVRKKEVLRSFLYPAYFLTISTLITLSSFLYNFRNIFTYHPVNLIYLIASAVLSLWSVQEEPFKRWFFRFRGRKIHENPLVWTLLMSIRFFGTNERFVHILSTWNAPTAPVVYNNPHGIDFPNWFAYRITILSENLTRNIESLQILNARRIPCYNSAAWLYQVYGILPVLAVLILLAESFLLLRHCTKHSGRFCRYLYTVLLLRTVLGLLANLLLVYSTDITPIIMGRLPLDIIFVILILCSRTARNAAVALANPETSNENTGDKL